MKAKNVLQVIVSVCLMLSGVRAIAGDLDCYGKTSTTSHFECLFPTGNCVWWAAYMRPDLAAAITGSGWSGGQWYDQFKKRGFSVGQEPRGGAIVEFNPPGHVAYVKKVNGDGSFDVSEMDATGRLGSGGIYDATYYPDEPNNNGTVTYHRNSGPKGGWTLKGFIYKENRPYNLNIHYDGNVGWYPLGLCQDAERWYRLSQENGKTIAISADKSVCDGVALMCYVP